MKLYFNGCSFTYGDELKNPKEFSWPVLLAKSTNAGFVNDAFCNVHLIVHWQLNRYERYFAFAWVKLFILDIWIVFVKFLVQIQQMKLQQAVSRHKKHRQKVNGKHEVAKIYKCLIFKSFNK